MPPPCQPLHPASRDRALDFSENEPMPLSPPQKRDTQIAARSVAHFQELGLKASFDSATQTALFINREESLQKLATGFQVAHPDVAMHHLLAFHKATLLKIDSAAKAGRQVRLSSARVHQYYSLIYHLLDEPKAHVEEQREVIRKAFTALKLPAPLNVQELLPHVPQIIATTSPTFQIKFR